MDAPPTRVDLIPSRPRTVTHRNSIATAHRPLTGGASFAFELSLLLSVLLLGARGAVI